LLDLINQNAIKFNQIKALVIDEVDRLMKGDFQEEIDSIFKLMPSKRQNLMFTATFPESIRKLVRKVMNEPEIINVDDLYDDITITQRVITVNHDKKNDLLAHLLKENDWKQVLVFCSAKRSCDNLVKKLEKRDISAVAMHGNLQQNARARALSDFKAGDTRVLIATDVAGRGIDIGQLPCVINYELPRSPNDYTHRIGRTGRAGEAGTAISLITHNDYQHFKVIEKRNRVSLEREQIAGFEADKVAPEAPKRTQAKKKGKGKKRKVLVNKKNEAKKSKQAERDLATKEVAKAKKEKFTEKARAKRQKEKELRKENEDQGAQAEPSSFYAKPKQSSSAQATTGKTKSERVAFDDKEAKPAKAIKSTEKPKTPPSGASLYTRKLPKV
jgi:superfamily II DNA/RNA helicase